jgi:hypothetical protein
MRSRPEELGRSLVGLPRTHHLNDCREMFRWLRDILEPGWENDSGTVVSAMSSPKITPRLIEQ